MTSVSKVLAVLVVTMSLAFLGFVSAMLVGGPNWFAQRRDELLLREGYTFKRSEGEVVSWSTSRGDEQLAGGMLFEAKAIVKARSDLENRQRAEIGELSDETKKLQDQLDQLQAWIEVDRQALENRAATLQYLLDQQAEQIAAIAVETAKVNEQGVQTQATLKARREDAQRLQQQIEELIAETERIIAHEELLEDRLTIMLGEISRLKARRDRLQSRVATAPAA